jgi:pimeloyl-ACP methyl ester carboxylesterase
VAWEPPYMPLTDADTRAGFVALAAATERAHAAGGPTAAAATFLDGVAGSGAWQGLPARARAFLAAQGGGAYVDVAMAGLDPAGLPRIRVPVTVARAVVERVPGARLATLDGLRHTAPITDPEPIAAAILDAMAAAGILPRQEVHL